MERLTAIDLFSGCGGLTSGLKRANFRVLGAIDNNPLATATYRRNHRGTRLWTADIRDVSVTRVKRELGLVKGELSLLAGCPPCQGFSSMRTRNQRQRARDPRNALVTEFGRFVRELLPLTVMMENVPRLESHWRLTQLRSELRSLGYNVRVKVLNVADYGVPQRRRRLVLLASRLGSIEFPEPLSERRTVRDAIGEISPAGRSGDLLHDFAESRSKRVQELIRSVPRDGGSRTDLSPRRQLECHQRIDGFKDVYGRMSWDDVAPTITSGCVNPSKGRFLHPRFDRAITLREAALLQGFPPNYFFSLENGKFAVAEMIGNALPPEFSRRQAAHLRKHLRNHLM